MSKEFLELAASIHEPELRAQALDSVEELLKLGVKDVGELEAFLRTEPTALHTTASWLLGRLGSKSSAAVLFDVLAHPDSSRALMMQSAHGLSLLKSKRTLKPIIALMLEDENPDRREAATYAILWFEDERSHEGLIEVLENTEEEPRIRALAAEGLSMLHAYSDKRKQKYKQACAVLIEALKDKSIEVRFWSAFALGNLRSKAAIPHLKKLARRDKSVLKGWWSVKDEANDAVKSILGQEVPHRERQAN